MAKSPAQRQRERRKKFRESLQKKELARRAREYTITIDEAERFILMQPLERLMVSERTKPEKQLLKMLREAKPDKKDSGKSEAKSNSKPRTKRLNSVVSEDARRAARARLKAKAAKERGKKLRGRK